MNAIWQAEVVCRGIIDENELLVVIAGFDLYFCFSSAKNKGGDGSRAQFQDLQHLRIDTQDTGR